MKLKMIAFCIVVLVASVQCAGQPSAESPSPESPSAESPSAESPSAAAPSAGEQSPAAAALATLNIKGRAPMTGYGRDRFGPAWLDADRNGCDTRNDVLAEHLLNPEFESNQCVLTRGDYLDPYTGSEIAYVQGDGNLIDIDHVVALGNAWATGAVGWPIEKRAAFANDPLNLLPADAGANRQKGDGDAATWLPPNKSFRCAYVARQIAVKVKYALHLTNPEASAMQRILDSCPEEDLPIDTWQAPTRVDHRLTDPGAATPTPAGSVLFESCDAARAAGEAPVRRGDRGYGSHLDGDGDGIACE